MSTSMRTLVGTTQPPVQLEPAYPGVNRRDKAIKIPPPYSAKVKHE
jgi:hypothetical protein